MVQIQGYFDLRFEAVRDQFAALFEGSQERGAALCVRVGGETVLDLWAGTADKDGQQAWHSDTLLNLFSCTKTYAAVTALQLVGRASSTSMHRSPACGRSSLPPARSASPCATCSAIVRACRRSASRCRPRRSTTGTP